MLGSYKSLFQGIVTGIQFVVKRTDYGTDFTAILWIYIILLGPHLKSSDRHVNVCVHVCLAGISRLFSLTSAVLHPGSWGNGELKIRLTVPHGPFICSDQSLNRKTVVEHPGNITQY